ncbi:hypothetical protein SAY87_031332 [Trapa incisa]|uniref:Negative regulator of systemic acquired resistance SNI1 n=1 Tax=Trapa incisa TaxID=236973 RepID=A0AAN7KVV0_9MYRT|nr:hypothetical protein SAY87_031332 [Trapa incisa]
MMQVDFRRRKGRGVFEVGIEENILAILDDAQEAQYSHDNSLAFLEAVRATSVAADDGIPPTIKLVVAVFRIFRTGKSLELIITSSQLLNELEQKFPRVFVDKGASESSSGSQPRLIVDEQAWSPFALNLDSDRVTSNEGPACPIDTLGFYLLIQELAGAVNDSNIQLQDIRYLRSMLLFQYLVNVIEVEFLARNRIYEETMQWTLLRESTLNILLNSRRVNYKSLVKDCLSIICGLHKIHASSNDFLEDSAAKSSKDSQISLAFASLEVEVEACVAVQKLMITITKLDELKKQADLKGFTTRADGVRTPLVEIVVNELTYDNEILSPVLQVLDHPRWKLELVLQYFAKYTTRPAVRTRRGTEPEEDATFYGTLRSLTNISSAKSVIKKIGSEALQLLLAHGFLAQISLPRKCSKSEALLYSILEVSLLEICREMISAFNNLRKAYSHLEILPIAKEALFVASTILSTKS